MCATSFYAYFLLRVTILMAKRTIFSRYVSCMPVAQRLQRLHRSVAERHGSVACQRRVIVKGASCQRGPRAATTRKLYCHSAMNETHSTSYTVIQYETRCEDVMAARESHTVSVIGRHDMRLPSCKLETAFICWHLLTF